MAGAPSSQEGHEGRCGESGAASRFVVDFLEVGCDWPSNSRALRVVVNAVFTCACVCVGINKSQNKGGKIVALS